MFSRLTKLKYVLKQDLQARFASLQTLVLREVDIICCLLICWGVKIHLLPISFGKSSGVLLCRSQVCIAVAYMADSQAALVGVRLARLAALGSHFTNGYMYAPVLQVSLADSEFFLIGRCVARLAALGSQRICINVLCNLRSKYCWRTC